MRRPRTWASFWTILAAIAGVIGAAAAVYPLLNTEQQFAHVTFDEDGFLGSMHMLRVEALSDPIILTGNWYLKRGPWWNASLLQTGGALTGPTDKSVAPMSRAYFVLDKAQLQHWIAPQKCPEVSGYCARDRTLVSCPENVGEIEIGIEVKTKIGTSWARRRLPYCVRSGADKPATDPSDAYWK